MRTFHALVAAATLLLAACGANTRLEADLSTPEPAAAPTQSALAVEASPTESNDACPAGSDASEVRLAQLEAEILTAMEGYDGEWGASVIDLGCSTELAVNPGYTQYTASAGKIVILIAILREVQGGSLPFEEVEELVIETMRFSSDWAATALNDMLEPEQVQEIVYEAGVSDATSFEFAWDYASMPAEDLGRVWAALLRGDLLNEGWTEYLLARAGETEIPDGFETFPHELSDPGYEYGQKAGYYVSDGIPYFLVGAGFVRPLEGGHPGYALVWLGRTLNPDFLDPQRRSVFPLMLDYIKGMDTGG